MDCIFCKIISGEFSSNTIYEDEIVKVILDINPVRNGHMLVIPKKHITNFTEMDNDTLTYINSVALKMQKLIYDKLNPDGLKLVVNYGCEQLVKHYHLHLIPEYLNNNELKDVNEIYNLLTK